MDVTLLSHPSQEDFCLDGFLLVEMDGRPPSPFLSFLPSLSFPSLSLFFLPSFFRLLSHSFSLSHSLYFLFYFLFIVWFVGEFYVNSSLFFPCISYRIVLTKSEMDSLNRYFLLFVSLFGKDGSIFLWRAWLGDKHYDRVLELAEVSLSPDEENNDECESEERKIS